MKHTRRTYLKTASALAVGSAGLGSLGSASAAPDYSLFNGRALWTWIPRQIVEDDAEQDRFFEQAAAHGIGTLYAHYDEVDQMEDPLAAAPDVDIEAFLRRCHDNDIEVHPMVGGGIAGWTASEVYPHAEQAVAWNESHSAAESFDGIHIDVENGGWQEIRDDLLDRFDGYPDDLTVSMAQHPKWVRHSENETLRTLMEHRNLDYYCTMVYDLNWATFWPNFGRAVQPWDTPYVLGQGGNEHGHPARNWSDADEMYAWVEENFAAGDPPTDYQYVTDATNDNYLGFALHSYWALIPAPRGETIGAPSQGYQTDPTGGGGGGGDDGGDDGDGGGGSNQPPAASVSASTTTVSVDETVTFDASGSNDSDGSIASYAWEFGDGATATGPTVDHSYGAAGDYAATVTVTDDAGATATASVSVTVESGDGGDDGDDGDDGGGGGGSVDCSAYSQYADATLYRSGDRAVYDGSLWEAVYATRANPPSAGNAYWTKVGDCQ